MDNAKTVNTQIPTHTDSTLKQIKAMQEMSKEIGSFTFLYKLDAKAKTKRIKAYLKKLSVL